MLFKSKCNQTHFYIKLFIKKNEKSNNDKINNGDNQISKH